jgi:hypothetical protein
MTFLMAKENYPRDQWRSLEFFFGGSGSNFFFPKAIFQVYRNFRGVETEYTEIFLHENYIPPISQKKFRGVGRPPGPYEASPLLVTYLGLIAYHLLVQNSVSPPPYVP